LTALLVFAGATWAGASLLALIAGMLLLMAAGEVTWWVIPPVLLTGLAVVAGGFVSLGFALQWTAHAATVH
jgi:mannose/fructose/N-acetylgalactosamine-specific phosphotransferase system component IIC